MKVPMNTPCEERRVDHQWREGYRLVGGLSRKKNNVYFFITRLTKDMNDDNPDFSKARNEITKAILKEIGTITE